MKKLILAVLMIATAATAQATELEAMKCVNYGYRESVLQVQGSYLIMQDTFFRNDGIFKLVNAYEKHFNQPKGSFGLRLGKIYVPTSQLNCATIGKLPMSCASNGGRATVQLTTYGRGDVPSLEISDELKLISLNLTGNLSSEGPIKIDGSEPVKVALDMYGVQMLAVVEFKGEQFEIEMETFFYNRPGVPGQTFSSCE